MNNTDLPRSLLEPEHPLIPALRKAIGCPIDWDKVPALAKRPALANDLRIYWAKVAEEFQSDREMRWYSRNEVEAQFNEALLRGIEINARTWRLRAISEYNRRVGFLKTLYFAGWDKYSKHRPLHKMTPGQIIAKTRRKGAVSLFFSDNVIPKCEDMLWEAVGDDLINIVTEHPDHLFVQSLRYLGACGGRRCNVIRIDLNYSNSEAHGHPRFALAGEKLLGVSYAEEIFSGYDYQNFSYNIDLPALKDTDAYVDFVCTQN